MIIVKRKLKLIILIIVFVLVSPVVILYATGDILGNGWSLLKTGGIYVDGAPADSIIYLNSKLKDTTSFFDRNIFLKSLRKGKYEVSVKKDGYNSWSEKVTVSDNLVSDANVFMLPKKVDLRVIPRYVLPNGVATTTYTKIKNQEYLDVQNIFAIKIPTVAKTTPTIRIDFKSNIGIKKSPIMEGKIGLWSEGGKIFSAWFGSNDLAPRYFCEADNCKKAILVTDLVDTPLRINFLPEYSGVAVIALNNKIFAIQIEQNPEKVAQTIYTGNNPDFRVSEGALYIKDGSFIAEVLL